MLIEEAFIDPTKIAAINHTRVVLIPKVESPSSLKEFRPISLCNVSFKILTKIITNRLKDFMEKLIGQE